MELLETGKTEIKLATDTAVLFEIGEALTEALARAADEAREDKASLAELAAEVATMLAALENILSTDPKALLEAGEAEAALAFDVMAWAGDLASGILDLVADQPGLEEMISATPEIGLPGPDDGQAGYFLGNQDYNDGGGSGSGDSVLEKWGASIGGAVQAGARWVVDHSDAEELYKLDPNPDGDETQRDLYERDPAPDGDEGAYEDYLNDPAPDGEEGATPDPTEPKGEPESSTVDEEMKREEDRSQVDPKSDERYFEAEDGEGVWYTDNKSKKEYYIDKEQYEHLKKRDEAENNADDDDWEEEDWDQPEESDEPEPDDGSDEEIPQDPNVDGGGEPIGPLPEDDPTYGLTQPEPTGEDGGTPDLEDEGLDPWILTDPDAEVFVFIEVRSPTYGLTQPEPTREGEGPAPDLPDPEPGTYSYETAEEIAHEASTLANEIDALLY